MSSWKRYTAICGCGVNFERASANKTTCDGCKKRRDVARRNDGRARHRASDDKAVQTPGKVSASCDNCGNRFWTYERNILNRAFCGVGCYRSATAAQERSCQACGKTFKRRKHGSDALKYCSRDCAWAGQRITRNEGKVDVSPYFAWLCLDCGCGLSSRRAPITRRCAECSRIKQLREVRERAVRQHRAEGRVKVCEVCLGQFCALYGTPNRSCCAPCQETRRRAQRKAAKLMRVAVKRGANGGEAFHPKEIFERDNWTCQLCKRKTPQHLRGSCDERAPELDHIVPVSHGGKHVRQNVQCLCRRCNGDKSARAFGQLWLIG